MPNNYGSWSGGAPGEDILNDPRYWGIEDDGPEPEEEDDEDEEDDDEVAL